MPERGTRRRSTELYSVLGTSVPLIERLRSSTAIPDYCSDCRQPFGPFDRRLWVGSRQYHEETCGPFARRPTGDET